MCYEALNDVGGSDFPVQLIWKKQIPTKVSFMIWSALNMAIPTTDNLKRRGFQLTSRCWFCKRCEETTPHVSLNCPFSSCVWDYLFRSYSLVWVQEGNLNQHLQA
ncbi:Reverse transcriptase zinc-binding domain [Macleaya cordata]|uniref:Reverse transcriptase zinc-binding domain n=1 Tax=Macleaya cordata TaxID=56857 RepID=A0A200QWH4_MACCD|nr:Reverse transcriptase zinc-binding domain [Macleaya cordata]